MNNAWNRKGLPTMKQPSKPFSSLILGLSTLTLGQTAFIAPPSEQESDESDPELALSGGSSSSLHHDVGPSLASANNNASSSDDEPLLFDLRAEEIEEDEHPYGGLVR
jgi:hypothetical protein